MNRRERIIEEIKGSSAPLSASALAKKLHVSRQIIVGDIALIRASGTQIIATPRGYVWEQKESGYCAKVAVLHSEEQMRLELYTIIDQGAEVIDVIVEHPIYGELCAPLHLASRYDADQFLLRMQDSAPLSLLTHGVHLHTIRCKQEDGIRRVKQALQESGLLYGQQDSLKR